MGKDTGTRNTRWRCMASENIAWIGWAQDHIAYHRPSGITHFLNASSKKLITEILREPAELDDIVQAFGVPERDAERLARLDDMRSMLEHLEHLGFVQQL